MRIKLQATNFKLTPANEVMVNAKLTEPARKLLKKIDEKADIVFDVELELITKHHRKGQIWRAEAQLNLPGLQNLLRAEATAESLGQAVNSVKRELLKEIKKYKHQ
ncbi:MAG: HPF/RaiA family ribosome-associated protein [Patescibacteria group bacterium]